MGHVTITLPGKNGLGASVPLRDKTPIERYMELAEFLLDRFEPKNVATLNEWWTDPINVKNRKNLGIVDGSAAYKRLVKKCKQIKKSLVATDQI
jgi:hypothetical protein